jgi:hypothetical protein
MADRFYLVTFDIKNSKGREAEYSQVRGALLTLVGRSNYLRSIKQCCLVRTPLPASALRNSVKQILGYNCNILVVRLAFGYGIDIKDAATRLDTLKFLNSIPKR